MRHSLLDGFASALQILGEIARVEIRLYGHHAATDVHTDRSRDDRTLGRDHAADRGAYAPVDVWHRGDPFENERKLRNIYQLLTRLIFKRHALGPRFDGYALLG